MFRSSPTLSLITVVICLLLLGSAPVLSISNSIGNDSDMWAEAASLDPSISRGPDAPVLLGPVDADTYLVGPGDRFSITVWGQGVASHSATVTPEGELVLPGIATVAVAGKSLANVKSDVRASLDEHYRDVAVSVSLVGLRSMLVNVLGHVEKPGIYEGTALDPAGELIRRAGGLAEGASRRNIMITRRNGDAQRVDLTRYCNAGDVSANPPILDGDLIFVPHATEFVYVFGAVAAPGRYEFVEGETVGSLLELGGGFVRGAAIDSVEIRRFVDDFVTETSLVDVSGRSAMSIGLTDGDQVYVREINEWRRVTSVEVRGEVARPGPYGMSEGEDRLSDIIRKAGGPTPEASLGNASLIRPSLGGEVDLELERLGSMAVGEMSEMEYAYFKTRLRDRTAVVVDFEKALSGDVSEDVPLLDGDIIVIPKAVATVDVIGQVLDPGEVEYVPGKRFRYYVEQAGGYSPYARANRVKVIRAGTGTRLPAGRAGRIDPGDVVWVPERVETDWWKLVREAASFLTSIVTAYVVIDQATGG